MSPPSDGPLTNDTFIDLEWTDVTSPANGDSNITTYVVYWDQGNYTNIWEVLVGESTSPYLGTYYQFSNGVVPGVLYSFKIQAVNVWGSSPMSTVVQILAAYKPGQMTPIVTSIDPTTGDIIFTWAYPDDRGDPITSYTIEFQEINGTYSQDTTYCNGSDPSIVSSRTCKVPMSVFTSSPYSLSYGTLVVARGSATNNYGTSTSSSPNTFGATIETQPLQMTAPYMISRWNESIMIGWNSETGSNTGGSSILNYTLYFD